jgi:predicted nucleotidyltransferase
VNNVRQETLLKIVGAMREDLDRGLTILAVSKKLKIGYRPAYNHLNTMGREGIITIEKIGHAKQCFLNLSNEKCRHLLAELDALKKEEICNENPKIKAVIENLISKLAKENISDIHSVILFGSYAKGAATKTSDIDLLFIVADLKNKRVRESIEQESASYRYSHNIKISPLITDINEFQKMLKSEELNVGKETRAHGTSLYGSEMFWRLVA